MSKERVSLSNVGMVYTKKFENVGLAPTVLYLNSVTSTGGFSG